MTFNQLPIKQVDDFYMKGVYFLGEWTWIPNSLMIGRDRKVLLTSLVHKVPYFGDSRHTSRRTEWILSSNSYKYGVSKDHFT